MHIRALFVISLVAAFSSSAFGALAPAVQDALNAFKTKFGDRWAVDTTPDGRHITSLTGAPPAAGTLTPNVIALAASVRRMTGFDNIIFNNDPLVPSTLGPILQFTWPQVVDNQVVENAAIIVQYSTERGPVDIVLNVAVPEDPVPKEVRDGLMAREFAENLVKKEMQCPPLPLALRLVNLDADAASLQVTAELSRPNSYFLAYDRKLWRVYDVLVRVSAVTRCGPVTVLLREYAINAATDSENPQKSVVRVKNLTMPAVEGVARGFNPNPVNTLRLEKLPDDLIFDVTKPPHFEQKLHGLNHSANLSYSLTGTYVRIQERACPDSVPLPVTSLDQKPNFTIERGGAQFAAANAYYHVDSMARWIADTLKIPETVPSELDVDVRSGDTASTPDAGYVRDKDPYLWFTVTNVRKIFVAEDGDAVAHEYAHAVLDATTNGFFSQEPAVTGKIEARAINEGFADYWALSTFSKQTSDNKHRLDCFMEWGNEGKCLRYYPFASYKTFKPEYFDHVNGQIWSGTLYEIFTLLKNNRELADSIVLSGHLLRARKGDAPTMNQIANGIVIAAAQREQAVTKDKICEIFKKHEFGDVTCCTQVGCTEDWKP